MLFYCAIICVLDCTLSLVLSSHFSQVLGLLHRLLPGEPVLHHRRAAGDDVRGAAVHLEGQLGQAADGAGGGVPLLHGPRCN